MGYTLETENYSFSLFCMNRFGCMFAIVWYGLVWFGIVSHGFLLFGMVWYGMV